MTIKKSYVDTCDGQIHYRYDLSGEGTPVVFFHQTASSSASFEKIMELIDGRFPMYAMDTPGFGQSFFPPDKATTAYYVSILLEALYNLGIEKFHAFGHHTGAAIAVEMAATAPDRIESIMLDGPVYLNAAELQHWLDTAIDPMVIQPDGSHLMKIWDRVVSLDPDHPKELCHREAIDTLRAGERWHEAYITVFTQDAYDMFSKVQCPMMLLCGENDVLMPYFQPCCDAFPEAKSHVLKNSGVYAPDNSALQIAEAIQDFLNGL
ncbi:MAG: alpha/beta fold hydrolase [Dissulfuribacterales bacterium]